MLLGGVPIQYTTDATGESLQKLIGFCFRRFSKSIVSQCASTGGTVPCTERIAKNGNYL